MNEAERLANTRHNFLALGLDYSCFLIGMSFASQVTILPAFAARLAAIALPDPDGREVRLGSLWSEQPEVLVFLRHYG